MTPGLVLAYGHWLALFGLVVCLWLGWHLTARRRPEPSTSRKALGAGLAALIGLGIASGYGWWCLKQVRASAPHPTWIVTLGALTPQRHSIILEEYNSLRRQADAALPEGCSFTCSKRGPIERRLVGRLISFQRLTGICDAEPLVPLAIFDPAYTQSVAERMLECRSPGLRSLALERLADDDFQLASDLFAHAATEYIVQPPNAEWEALAREVETHWLAGQWRRASQALERAKLPNQAAQRRVKCAGDALLVMALGSEEADASARLEAAARQDATCALIAANLKPEARKASLEQMTDARLSPLAKAIRTDLLNLTATHAEPRCSAEAADFGSLAWREALPAPTLLSETGRRALKAGVVSRSGVGIQVQHCASQARAQLGDSVGALRALQALEPSGDALPRTTFMPGDLDEVVLRFLEGDSRTALAHFESPELDGPGHHQRLHKALLISTRQQQLPKLLDADHCTFADCLLVAQAPAQREKLRQRLEFDLHHARLTPNPERRLFELSWARWLAIALDERELVQTIEDNQKQARTHGLQWRLAAVLALLETGPQGLETAN